MYSDFMGGCNKSIYFDFYFWTVKHKKFCDIHYALTFGARYQKQTSGWGCGEMCCVNKINVVQKFMFENQR